MAAAAGRGTSASFRFRPRDHELIDHFLRPKIAGQPFPFDAGFIHDADVCSAAGPGELARMYAPAPGPAWYFFSPARYSRCGGRRASGMAAGGGCWKLASRPRKVKGGGGAVKYMRHFSYTKRDAVNVWRPEWMMVEYGIAPEDGAREELVLCKVYRSPLAHLPRSGPRHRLPHSMPRPAPAAGV